MAVCVLWLFLTVPWIDLQFLISAFPSHTHLHFADCFTFIVFSPLCGCLCLCIKRTITEVLETLNVPRHMISNNVAF